MAASRDTTRAAVRGRPPRGDSKPHTRESGAGPQGEDGDEFYRQLASGDLAYEATGSGAGFLDVAGAAPITGGERAGSTAVRQAPSTTAQAGRARSQRGVGTTTGHRGPATRRGAIVGLGVLLVAMGSIGTLVVGGEAGHGNGGGRPTSGHEQPRARLEAAWLGTRKADLAVPRRPGKRVRIAGRLTAAGSPVGAAKIDVLGADGDHPERGSQLVGELRTDAHGRFATAVMLDAGAQHKVLTFRYAPQPGGPPGASATANLYARRADTHVSGGDALTDERR